MNGFFFGLIIAVCLMSLGIPAQAERAMRGSLVKARGEVMILAKGKTEWTRAHERMSVGQGDRIKTGAGGEAVVRMSPRNLISIQPNSEIGINVATVTTERGEGNGVIRVPRQVQKIETDLSRGRAINILKGLRGNSEYSMRTPTAVAGVRGTIFMCGISALGASEFACFEGQISLMPTPGGDGNFEAMMLDAGQFVSITPAFGGDGGAPDGAPGEAGLPASGNGEVAEVPADMASDVAVSTVLIEAISGDFSTAPQELQTETMAAPTSSSSTSTTVATVECF